MTALVSWSEIGIGEEADAASDSTDLPVMVVLTCRSSPPPVYWTSRCRRLGGTRLPVETTEASGEFFCAEIGGGKPHNGYGWRGEERVYNPFDILLLFDKREFGAWWFEIGTPAFLIETLFGRRVSSVALGEMMGTGDLLSAFDVDDMATEALLFQTGYLTITDEQDLGGEPLYRLGYPNREVRQSLHRSLLRYLVRDRSRQTVNSMRLAALLQTNDFAGMEALFHAFYASIPHEWYTNNDIARYEGYYASVFYSYFAGLGLDITVEDSTNHGRLDMAVRFNANVYLFELNVVEMAGEGAAMAQLNERGYAEKYRRRGEPIHLVAVEFSRATRNVVAFEVERGWAVGSPGAGPAGPRREHVSDEPRRGREVGKLPDRGDAAPCIAVRPERVRRSSLRPRACRAQATTPASAWGRRVKVASTSRSSAERVVVRMRSPSRNLRRRGNRSRAGISHRTS